MWIILYLVCFEQFASSIAQEFTNFDQQTSIIDSSEINQGVKWDSTRPPVTLTIRSGRSDRINRTQDVNYDDDPRYYSNEWQPILMPIGFNNQRDDRNKYQMDNGYSVNYPFEPMFLRRPDSDQNKTASSDSYTSINKRDTPPSTSVPTAPVMFYPPPFGFYPNDINGYDINAVENYSTSVTGRDISESVPANSDESQSETSQTENFPLTTDIARRFYAENPYRNADRFLPPRSSPYIPPSPFFPYPGIPPYQTLFNPNFNRPLPTGGNLPPADVSQIEAQSNSDNDATHEENIPKAASTNVPLLPPYPFPSVAYPYGFVPPPPFVPPFLPNVPTSTGRSVLPSGPLSRDPFIANFPPRGVPFNALFPPSPKVPQEASETGEILPPPIFETNPPLEPASAIPQVVDLPPEVPVELNAETENILENERPNVGKIPYEFGFDMNDGQGTDQHRKEVSDGSGIVTGSYGYRDLLGVYRLVNYIADKDGFRAFIKSNEPGVASAGSANVVVMAESPPPGAIAEGLKASEPQAVIVPDEAVDIVAAASEVESK